MLGIGYTCKNRLAQLIKLFLDFYCFEFIDLDNEKVVQWYEATMVISISSISFITDPVLFNVHVTNLDHPGTFNLT